MLLANGIRQLQHAHKHCRHHLCVGDLELGDRGEVLLGVEVFHDDGRATESMHGHVEAEWSRVIQRCRREVSSCLVEPEDELREHEQTRRGAERFRLVNERDAFGATGRTARVEHVGALETFGEWR